MKSVKPSKDLQPPVGVFAEIFEGLAEEGAQIIVNPYVSCLIWYSGSCTSRATLANADVTVIDGNFTDQAMKFQVVEAAKLAQEGC